MANTNRPLFNHSADDLMGYFAANHENRAGLDVLRHELAFRKTKQAYELEQHVADAYAKLPDREVKSLTLSPKSTDGQGGPWTELPNIGFLKKMGYSVGQKGVTVLKRRQILDQLYLTKVPSKFPEQYRIGWGMPSSGKRLQKLAGVIAAFARNAKQKNQNVHMDEAITDYEGDLAYLKEKYYDRRWSFAWPTTLVT